MKTIILFNNRQEAGSYLTNLIQKSGIQPDLVLSLPRGGTIVAAEIARILNLEHDLIIVRKIGAPYDPEVAIGAITQQGKFISNEKIIDALNISRDYIETQCQLELKEIHRRLINLRGKRPFTELKSKSVLIVDDGLATGYTMEAAILSIKDQHPKKIYIAVPVAPPEVVQRLNPLVDQLICPQTPENFTSVSNYYEDFHQINDDELQKILLK
ncbi:MAG TPA: phosphoribosyltransferase [Bacillota bacterium]|nr:phosphoribosyltransferase [Bacillota bacterium]HOL10250.1 phosphoribosyltransferase [Bacillota bacterium]